MSDHIPVEDFAAYVDGLLAADKKSELEGHFASCPACLDELAEIAAILHGRQVKIPNGFLTKALGEKNKTTKPVLRLRLVFEIAAALVVVVFIGYLFFANNPFWQTPEQQKPSVLMDKDVRPGGAPAAVPAEEIALLTLEKRSRSDASKASGEQIKTAADRHPDDSRAADKRKSTVGDKGLPFAQSEYLPAGKGEKKLQESAAEKPQPAAVPENLPKKELALSAAESEAYSDVQINFAAKDQVAARMTEAKGAGLEQNLERQKEPGASVALPSAAKAREGKLNDEEAALKKNVVAPPVTGAVQPAYAGKKQDAALACKETADKKIMPPVRIEGDVAWSDLLNAELFSTWSWLPKDLALELQIDGTGTVTAAVPLGKSDPALARQAENEAKKMLFPVSKKKARRARLLANEKRPSPDELNKDKK